MKKKILSVLLCLCMVMALLPTTALAASGAPSTIYICGMPLTNGDCLTDNDATSATAYTNGDPYVALYQDGILHLNGLNKTYAGVAEGNRALNWIYYDLVIELAEGSVNTLVDTNYGAINGASGPSLTIQGNGTLNVTGGTNGIWVWEDVVIQDGATVNVIGNGTTNTGGVHHAGICTNASGHGLTIKQGTNVTISGEGYGVSADNTATGLFTVLGGNLVIRGKNAALHKLDSNFAGNTVYVSSNFDGSGETVWDNTTDLTSYKYIRLSGFSSGATTYNVTKDTTTNGSFAVDYSKSMAGETVTITAAPASGYEVNTVTVTDADSGTVAVSGTGNSRTFTMPAKDVTVKVTFQLIPPTYTVTFNANGHGTAPGSQQVASGQKVTEPAAPTASGYTFGGWYKEVGCTTPWDFNTDTVDSGIILYAKWTATSSATLEETNFTHAYDVQRSPAFPTKNQPIELSGLYYPILSGGTRGSQNTGSWKLTKAGTYSYMKSIIANSANLDSIVTDVVGKYTSLNPDEVVIHELKDGNTHIAYGVVVAYDTANGNAVFLGDSLSGGAGYLLATGVRSGTISATASEVATDYVQTATYGISLDVDENDVYAFDPVTEGYVALIPKAVTVTNTGDAATGDLAAALSGTNADSFTLSKTSISSIAVSGSDAFTVVPKTGLSAGTYTATVTVSGTNIASHAFDVSFTVRPEGAYIITFDPNGGSVTPTFDFTGGSGNLSSLPTPTRSSYTFNGWYTAASGGTKVETSTVFSEDTTIYARWTYSGGSSSDSSSTPTYKVESEVSKDADGGVSFSKSNAKKGDTVTITVTPDRYYKVDGVTVKDKNGKEIAVTDNGDGTFTFQMPASKVTVEPVFSWDNPFADVAEDTYYAPAVEWALKNDVTGGTGDGTTFSPDAGCTRAQIVTFLWRAAGCPEPAGTNSFTDVSADAYYAKAVAWAVEQGITNGTGDGTTFSPNATCTRSQSMTFLYHAAGSPGVFDNIAFSDVAAGSYYADAVVWAAQNGVTSGTGDGTTFSPNAACTRGQIMTFLYRWLVK